MPTTANPAPIDDPRPRGGAGTLLLVGAVALLALPSATLAFSSRFEPATDPAQAGAGASGFVPAEVDPRLSRSIAVRALSKGRLFRFTPAASPTPLDRSVTVAVRLDPRGAAAIVVRGVRAPSELALASAAPGLAPLGYSLGAARGYKTFAQSPAAHPADLGAGLPDLASFRPSPGAADEPSRFSTRIALDGQPKAGRAPRTFAGQSDPTVDVGGAYRVTRNFDVMAGVRYTGQRDRLQPLTDGRNDSQSVYVGTKFHF